MVLNYSEATNIAQFVQYRESFQTSMRNCLSWGNSLLNNIESLKTNTNYSTLISSEHQARIEALNTAASDAVMLLQSTLDAEISDISSI